jgi:hypothetical protein
MDWPLITVVSALLSNEYPIDETFSDAQLTEDAESENREPTSVLLAGLLTTTLATAGTARVASSDEATDSFWMMFIGFLWDGLQVVTKHSLFSLFDEGAG